METRRLLDAGLVAGPLFVTVVAAQLLTRDGFDITHQPISLLSLGEAGWVQITNFVVAGLLSLAFARGLSRTLVEGRGSVWAPRLMTVYGVGLVAGGVFVADPALGYPVGTPDEIPDSLSWHSMIHAVAPPLAFTALVAACIVLALRYKAAGERGWSAYSAGTGVTSFVLSAWPDVDSTSWRLAIAIVIGFAWVTALAARERAALAQPTAPLASSTSPSMGTNSTTLGSPGLSPRLRCGWSRHARSLSLTSRLDQP
jgi:hypothetical protein